MLDSSHMVEAIPVYAKGVDWEQAAPPEPDQLW